MVDTARIDAIMDYWFGDLKTADFAGHEKMALWFGGTLEIDCDIHRLFKTDLEKAIAGEYDHWSTTPRGALALIILLDQFSRHIYRGQLAAFNQDKKALSLCLQGIKKSQDHELTLLQRVFFYMPLEHAENLALQEQSLIAFQRLSAMAIPETASLYRIFLEYAFIHYDIIKQFGRFPHRNAILKRSSTPSESLFLAKSHTHG